MKDEAKSIQVTSLRLPSGSWRLCWHGHIAYPNRDHRYSQPSIELLFESITPDGDSSPRSRIARSIPIGFLGHFSLGSIWSDGHRLGAAISEVTSITIDVSPESCKLLKAGSPATPENPHSSHLLPFDAFDKHRSHTGAYCAVVRSADGESGIVIPCVELVRMYFGSSSSLLSRVVTGAKEDKFYVSRGTGDDGASFVRLAPGLAKASGADVARIAFDPIAARAAHGVAKHLVAQSVRGEKPYILMSFPFEGKTTLQVSGEWITANGQKRLLVHQIHSCSHPFPFNALRVQTSRPLKQDATAEESPGQERKDSKRMVRKNTSNEFVTEEPRKRAWPSAVAAVDRQRFPDLADKKTDYVGERTVEVKRDTLHGKPTETARSVGEEGEGVSTGPTHVDIEISESRANPPTFRLQHIRTALMESLAAEGKTAHTTWTSKREGKVSQAIGFATWIDRRVVVFVRLSSTRGLIRSSVRKQDEPFEVTLKRIVVDDYTHHAFVTPADDVVSRLKDALAAADSSLNCAEPEKLIVSSGTD